MAEDKIKAEQICIADLFGDKYLFEIPDYQRPFVWKQDNFEQLFDDIRDEIEKNRIKYNAFKDYEPYFLGSIVLYVKESGLNEFGRYEIIDGRQRLMSLSILMATIRDAAPHGSKAIDVMQRKIYQEEDEYEGTKASVRIEVKRSERRFYKEYILTASGTAMFCENTRNDKRRIKKLKQSLGSSESRMVDAIQVFQNRLLALSKDSSANEPTLDQYIKYLLQKVVIVIVKTNSLESAFRLFKTLNKRGVEIGNADILKSENIGAVSEEERAEYAQVWMDLEEQGTSPNSIDVEKLIDFVRVILIPERQTRGLFQDFEDKLFSKTESLKGKKFIEYVAKISDIYSRYVDFPKLDIDALRKSNHYYNLVSLMRNFFVFDEWISAVLHFMDKFSDEHGLYEFTLKLEKLIFIDWLIGFTQEKRLSRIFDLIKLINDTDTSDALLSNSIFDNSLRREAFLEAIDSIEFYNKGSTKLAKYTLLRIDMERRDQLNYQGSYSGEISVEHVLPERPSDNYWLTRFDEDMRAEWTDRIGNLTLLDRRKNTKAANKPFPEKKVYFFERNRKQVKETAFSITNEFKEINEWNLEVLKNRHRQLKSEASQIWMR